MPGVATFGYERASSVQEALMLASSEPRARFWAGGTDLMLAWTSGDVQIDRCVDVSRIAELQGIDVAPDRIRIGAATTFREIERSGEKHPLLKSLADIARIACTAQTRTLATVGGNICNASPAADLVPPLVALDARASIQSTDERRVIPLIDVFAGVKETALRSDELLVDITIPVVPRRRMAFGRVARTSIDIALVIVASSLAVDDDGQVADARVVLGCVGPRPLRSEAGERVLVGLRLDEMDDAIEVASGAAMADARPIDDLRCSAAYRSELVRVLARRSLTAVADEIRREIVS